MNGQRVTYRKADGKTRTGVILSTETMLGARYYRILNDASGIVTNVLPQWIIR